MLPYIILYRVKRGHWYLGLSPRMPIWHDHQRWAVPPGGEWGAHVDVIGPAAERLDLLDLGPYPCFVAEIPRGNLIQVHPPRFVLRDRVGESRIRVADLETDTEVWSRGWVPATYDDVKKAAAQACKGMNDRLLRRRLQDAARHGQMIRPEPKLLDPKDAFPDMPRP
jgi:hypothetical protein